MALKRSSIIMATAALLGGAAAFVQTKKSQAERQNPPEGKFTDVDGIRLHYLERGTGPTLVLLHGNLFDSRDFLLIDFLDAASARYRVLVFDRPGFGYSERPRDRVWTAPRQAELLHRTLRQLGVERPYVMGHSWGAFVALELALNYPTSIAGVVLVAGYYYPTIRFDPLLPTLLVLPILGDLMRYTIAPLAGRAMWPATLRLIFEPAEVPARYDAYPVWLALRPSQLRATAEEGALMIPSAFAFRERLHALAVPSTIIAGEQDGVVETEKQSVRLHHELPGSLLRVIEGNGHMVHHTAPKAVMNAINDLARSTSEGRLESSAI